VGSVIAAAPARAAGATVIGEMIHSLADFTKLVKAAPKLLKRLQAAERHLMIDLSDVPAVPGIYLLSEGDRPMYVGQSRNVRSRLRRHQRENAGSEEASYAFSLARREARQAGHPIPKSRRACQDDPLFAELFSAARRRVGRMHVQVIELPSPIDRTLFEVYASLALETDNTFETH